ncbi:DUF447 domain-containing protein [Methanohalobium sp.]|uniref:DUF447 domain-containing protein n=1 Tax=Methanohalobium sp. TaxID=2837493 RepID=UPI0025F6B9E9|nr:DUF447 domain-containing protein [Methanohalobium sp.]
MNQNNINIEEYGIYDGISETIFTTGTDSPNAAPMGLIRKGDRIQIRLFKGSQTYENVVNEKCLVANVIIDPVVFARSTFTNLYDEEFDTVSVNNRKYPFLKKALSYVIFECSDIRYTKNTLVADVLPLYACINRNVIKAPNRGFNAVLDALIHATRYRVFDNEKYLNIVYELSNTVKKCGGSKENRAMEILYDYLNIEH